MSSLPNYRGYRFPPEVISHAVWLYHRFTLSLRDIEDLLAERNVIDIVRNDQAMVCHVWPRLREAPPKAMRSGWRSLVS